MVKQKENRGGARPGAGQPEIKKQLKVEGAQSPPKMPRGLRPHAKKVWELAVDSLPHVLRPLDEPALRLCCEAYQMAMDAIENDDSKAFVSAFTKFEAMAGKIGLTPHSRRTIKPADDGKDDKDTEDPFEVWKTRGGLN